MRVIRLASIAIGALLLQSAGGVAVVAHNSATTVGGGTTTRTILDGTVVERTESLVSWDFQPLDGADRKLIAADGARLRRRATARRLTASTSDASVATQTQSQKIQWPLRLEAQSTVVASLIDHGVYPQDVLLNDALFAIDTRPYGHLKPWRFNSTATFPAPEPGSNRRYSLSLSALNYRADVFVNGIQCGASNATVPAVGGDNATFVAGAFRSFEIDITAIANATTAHRAASGPVTFDVVVIMYASRDHVFAKWGYNSTDLSMTFVDWAPQPPDRNLGFWKEVPALRFYQFSEAAAPRPTSPALDVTAIEPISGSNPPAYRVTFAPSLVLSFVPGSFPTGSASRLVYIQITVDLPESQTPVKFDAYHTVTAATSLVQMTPQTVVVSEGDLWWPWQMAPTEALVGRLCGLTVNTNVVRGGDTSQGAVAVFNVGLRQVTAEVRTVGTTSSNTQPALTFSVNGKRILIRGAGWAPDLFQRNQRPPVPPAVNHHFDTQFKYARGMGLNALRLEGKFPPREFFALADTYGMLILPGWCCCDAWQNWGWWQPEQYFIASESMRSIALRLRPHASVVTFLYSSDQLPPPRVEAMYLEVLRGVGWAVPTIQSAAATNSTISGPSGVKMSGPYSWVPPVYWTEGAATMQLGGAWGFLTEGGPGESPMTYASMLRTVAFNASALAAASAGVGTNYETNLHMGNPEGVFRNLRYFLPPAFARYGGEAHLTAPSMPSAPPSWSAQFFADVVCQLSQYESTRAMYSAYNSNKYTSTGSVFWMLNSAWPSNLWNLFDYYLTPAASYFAAKEAHAPLAASYNYGSGEVWITNGKYVPATALIPNASSDTAELTLTQELYEVTSSIGAVTLVNWSRLVFGATTVGSDSVTRGIAALTAPPPPAPPGTTSSPSVFMLRVRLTGAGGRAVGGATVNGGDTKKRGKHLGHRLIAVTPKRSVRNTAAASSSETVFTDGSYWLSSTMDILNWSDSTFYNTLVSQYANFSGPFLRALQHQNEPATGWVHSFLDVSACAVDAKTIRTTIRLNPAAQAANISALFLRVQLGVNAATGTAATKNTRFDPADHSLRPVVPLLQSANYFSLYPDASGQVVDRTVTLTLMELSGYVNAKAPFDGPQSTTPAPAANAAAEPFVILVNRVPFPVKASCA
jgi:hypothetical protein